MRTPPPIAPDLSWHDWTVEQMWELPDTGDRYEVIDGELLVTPAPSNRHQRVLRELLLLLAPYCRRAALDCLCAPSDVVFSPRRGVQPDLYVTPLLDGRPPERFTDVGQIVLAVEVLSPSTRRVDRELKRRLYMSERVAEYWVVDPDECAIDRWLHDRPTEDRRVIDQLEWRAGSADESLIIDVPALFERALPSA